MEKIEFDPHILNYFFDLKVREMCKSCKRYNSNAHCPPHIESVGYYKNLLPTYMNGVLFYKIWKCVDKTEWKNMGRQSSLELHRLLIEEREKLFQQGHYFSKIFGAGSCKLCESCSVPCRQPQNAISPIEATGIDVVKLMDHFDINVSFPIQDNFYRIGMMLYD